MRTKSLKIFFYSFLSFFLVSLFLSAYVNKFIDNSKIKITENYFSYLSFWLFISILIILFAFLLEKYLPKTKQHTLYLINQSIHKFASLFSLLLGFFFVKASILGFLFSVNINNINKLDYPIIIQAIIGLSFIFGIGVRTGSITLISLWFLSLVYAGPINSLTNIWVLGAALFTLIYGREYFKISKRKVFLNKHFLKYEYYALPFLRVFFGFNLLFLGLFKKIFFLENNINFLKGYKVSWFSDYFFIMSMGFLEVTLGIIFILGLATRINAWITLFSFSIILFFMETNKIIENIPYLLIIILLIIFGSGNKLKIYKENSN